MVKLSDLHQLWFTSADSFGNGHRLNASRPSIPQVAFRGGGLGCHQFKRLGKLSNGWTDWPHIWHTSADPCGNGYTPNKLPLETKGGHLGVLGVKHSKVWESCQTAGPIGTNFGSRCGFIWEWTYDKYNSPRNTPGAFRGVLGGPKFKCLGKLSNGLTDWHQIWYKSADSSGNGHRLNIIRPSIHQGAFWGFRGSQIQKS